MRSGNLRHRVTIQQRTVTGDGEGVISENWEDVATVWAAVEDLKGREFFQAAVVAAGTTRITIRYRPGVTASMRVLAGSRVFDIQSVLDPEGRRRELQLICQEVTGGG